MKGLTVDPVGAATLPDPLQQVILKSGDIAADMHDSGRRPGLQDLQKVMDLAVPAIELRALKSHAMLSAATKCCDLPDVTLIRTSPGIAAFILGNAKRTDLATIAQHRGEFDPVAPEFEPTRFDQAWRVEQKPSGVGASQFGNSRDRFRFAIAQIGMADQKIPAQDPHPRESVGPRQARAERGCGFAWAGLG